MTLCKVLFYGHAEYTIGWEKKIKLLMDFCAPLLNDSHYCLISSNESIGQRENERFLLFYENNQQLGKYRKAPNETFYDLCLLLLSINFLWSLRAIFSFPLNFLFLLTGSHHVTCALKRQQNFLHSHLTLWHDTPLTFARSEMRARHVAYQFPLSHHNLLMLMSYRYQRYLHA